MKPGPTGTSFNVNSYSALLGEGYVFRPGVCLRVGQRLGPGHSVRAVSHLGCWAGHGGRQRAVACAHGAGGEDLDGVVGGKEGGSGAAREACGRDRHVRGK